MTRQGRVCVLGSFMMDLAVRVDDLPRPGETVVGRDFGESVGGKGFNQAVAAARAGARVTMLGSVGDDGYGDRFLEYLAAEGIDHSLVRRRIGVGTGLGLPVVDGMGNNSIVIVPRANSAVEASDVEEWRPAIAECDIVLLQLELPWEAGAVAARIARSSGRSVIVNPAPARAVDLAGLVDVLVPNEVEAALLAGVPLDPGDPASATARLRERTGARCVIVTLGALGVACDDAGTVWTSAAHPVAAVDTVGAGDTFCGWLAARLAAGDQIDSAIREAVAASALSVTRRGAAASVPSRHDVAALMSATTPVGAGGAVRPELEVAP